ncbi:g5220 [Coccomyxa elongata]
MVSLEGLVLNHASPHLAAAARDIPRLTALQTLCISTVSWSDEAQELELALGGLRQLRQVKLEGILPAVLELPLDAALHVTVFDEWSAEHPVWQSVLPNMRTFKWDDDTWSLSRLPGVLQAPSGLIQVLLRMHEVGSSERPLRLRAAGSPAASICLACRDAWVDLGGATLRHVCITTDRIVLSGTQSCSERCPDLYLEYSALDEVPSEPLVVVPTRLGCWGATCRRTPMCGGRERLWKGTNAL